MDAPEDVTHPDIRRVWRKEDRAKISLMHLFRAHFEEHQPDDVHASESRRIQFRESITEQQLREHIEADLGALLSTVRLDACFQLDETTSARAPTIYEAKTPWAADYPYLAQSILNYGFIDLSDVKEGDLEKFGLVKLIRQSLIDHEPRLVAETIRVVVKKQSGARDQRLSLFVEADLMGDPVDYPLEFDADVDLGAGKLRLSKLRVQM